MANFNNWFDMPAVCTLQLQNAWLESRTRNGESVSVYWREFKIIFTVQLFNIFIMFCWAWMCSEVAAPTGLKGCPFRVQLVHSSGANFWVKVLQCVLLLSWMWHGVLLHSVHGWHCVQQGPEKCVVTFEIVFNLISAFSGMCGPQVLLRSLLN